MGVHPDLRVTETSPLLTINRAPAEWDALSAAERSVLLSRAGAPAMGVRIAVDDEGEVLARSNHVFAGYWDQPAESAAALEGGWFHTGDGGYVDDDAYVVISDRKKDVIITGGENVSSIEVEDCLYQHGAVAEVAVIGVPDERWGETVKALVVLRPGETVDEDELIAHCRDRWPISRRPFRGVPPGARPDGDGEAAEVQAAPALLGRARAWGQLVNSSISRPSD